MMHHILRSYRVAALCVSAIAGTALWPSLRATPEEVGSIRVHLLGHAIGSERYSIRDDAGGALALSDTFGFTDRGGPVRLVSALRLSSGLEPISLRSTGRTYRFVNVDADVNVDGNRVQVHSLGDSASFARPSHFFAIAGYAPLESQALLVRYWLTHGRPREITTAPADPTTTVRVEDLGSVTLRFASGSAIKLERYSIDGVAWGREIIYLDQASRFAAIATRANLLPLEGIREDLAAAQPALLDSVLADVARAELSIAAHTSAAIPVVTQGAFALVGARIIDGTTREPIDDGVVIVRDGRIAAVGRRSSTMIPNDMRTIDARGKTIIPGLWDMHAHVALPEWGPAYFGVGVTTIRDMGGEKQFLVAFRDAIAAGRPRSASDDARIDGRFGNRLRRAPSAARRSVERNGESPDRELGEQTCSHRSHSFLERAARPRLRHAALQLSTRIRRGALAASRIVR
jgi:hypothetical protein